MKKHLLFFLLLFFSVGCHGKMSNFFWQPSAYEKQTCAWTRHDVFYDGMEVALDVFVLLQSREWRRCSLEKSIRDYALSKEKWQPMLAEDQKASREGVDFFVAVSGSSAEDFASSAPLWQLYLSVNGQKILPQNIRKLKWSEMRFRSAFPFWTPWQQVYAVHFSVKPPKDCTLLLSGAYGKTVFFWQNM